MMQNHTQPRFRLEESDHVQIIPRVLLRAMALMVLATLALVTYAVITDRPHEGQIMTAPAIAAKMIQINARPDGGTEILDLDGSVLVSTPSDKDGFVTVVRRALDFNRHRAGVDTNPPVELVRFADGRVGLRDEASGWKMNLVGFGQDNVRSWNALIAD